MNSLRRQWIGFQALLILILLFAVQPANAFPAFARKYGLPCSACHEAWPKLNTFGQTFKDNGYQLMNDRDSPIWQNPSYWPVTFRMTPNWHRESVNKVAVDGALTGETQINSNGFDLSGLDILSGGTLYNNISFLLVTSFENTGEAGFESSWVRFDNLFKSPWLNLKVGKFELDNVISEKRTLTLSGVGGAYQLYHFVPVGDNNFFAQLGDNQLGVEVMGHSANDRTRYSAALISSNDGQVNLPNGNSYSGFFTASQGFDTGRFGVQRVGAYALVGNAPTFYLTSGGEPIPGSGKGNKPFYREGVFGLVYVKKLDFSLYYQHGWDSAFWGNSTPANGVLPAGARPAIWNGGFVETHYTVNPQLIFIQRDEFIRMSQQPLITNPSSLGNLDAYTFAMRWYPIMFSRAGFAIHPEYSLLRQQGVSPVSLSSVSSSSVFLGFDFDF
jgi:hypothetical protein